jgi:hypothetical protein
LVVFKVEFFEFLTWRAGYFSKNWPKKEIKNNLIYDETTHVLHFSQKMVKKEVGKVVFATNEIKQLAIGGHRFFFFWGESGGVGFLLFSFCSHQVRNVFHKMFPIVLHPISFALNSSCNYTSSPKEEIPTYLFWAI